MDHIGVKQSSFCVEFKIEFSGFLKAGSLYQTLYMTEARTSLRPATFLRILSDVVNI